MVMAIRGGCFNVQNPYMRGLSSGIPEKEVSLIKKKNLLPRHPAGVHEVPLRGMKPKVKYHIPVPGES